jgi:hypothetical protein
MPLVSITKDFTAYVCCDRDRFDDSEFGRDEVDLATFCSKCAVGNR